MTITNPRQLRGLAILSEGPESVRRVSEKKYQVKSQSNGSYYALSFDAGDWTCTCPDFKKRLKDCKHVFAILFSQKLRLEVMGTDPDAVPDAFLAECSKCGSSKTKRDGFRIVRGGRVQRYKCRDCGMKFALDKGFSRMKTAPKCVTVAMDLFFKGISLSKIQHHLSEF